MIGPSAVPAFIAWLARMKKKIAKTTRQQRTEAAPRRMRVVQFVAKAISFFQVEKDPRQLLHAYCCWRFSCFKKRYMQPSRAFYAG